MGNEAGGNHGLEGCLVTMGRISARAAVRERGFKEWIQLSSDDRHRSIETLARLSTDAARNDRSELLREAIETLRIQHEELVEAAERLAAQHEQMQELRALAERDRARYRKLFANPSDAYIMTDTNGTIHEINLVGKRLLNADAHAIAGTNLLTWLEADSGRVVREAMLKISQKEYLDFEVRFLQRGRRLPKRVLVRAMVFERGKRLLFVIREGARDIARSDNGENEVRRETLEALVAERTEYLVRGLREEAVQRAREREQRRLFEQRDKAKDRFLAVLSHDLRGPLSAVLGWTQLLRRQVLDATMSERALATIERNARSQLGLMEELLDLSRIVADKMPLEKVPLDLGLLVERCVEAMMPAAIEKGIVLEFTALASDVTVSGDRKRLEQVVTNLISNALKFTPRHGRVDVELSCDDKQAHLVVRDTGRGISSELLPHVFELFRQEDDGLTSKKGLGLGLYIVRHLTELHGGSVAAVSDGQRHGASFEVVLPLRDDIAAITSHPDDELGQEDLDGCSILVVDDDHDTRELVCTLLRQHKASVATATDARSALASFQNACPDVLLVDLGLPDVDGCTLIEQLRQVADVPAIALSGFATKCDVRRALEAGFAVHVAKPVETRRLVRTVNEIWNRQPASE